MRTPHRTLIRRYIAALLKQKVDVKERVFTNQPSPRYLKQLPCICVMYGTEDSKIERGDDYNPTEYEKDLRIIIDVITEEELRPDEDPEDNMSAEDAGDALGDQVEIAMEWDNYLEKLHPDYEPDVSEENLCRGLRQLSSTPYKVGEDADRRIMAQRLTFAVPYIRETYVADKLPNFLYYKVGITDPETGVQLTGAEGDVRV